jgi:DNA-directed RNA polymerase specialized sigma24 family protein
MRRRHSTRRWNATTAPDMVAVALDVLTDVQRPIIYMYYGFRFGGEMSDQDIADDIGMPRRTVCYHRYQALTSMREALETWMTTVTSAENQSMSTSPLRLTRG